MTGRRSDSFGAWAPIPDIAVGAESGSPGSLAGSNRSQPFTETQQVGVAEPR